MAELEYTEQDIFDSIPKQLPLTEEQIFATIPKEPREPTLYGTVPDRQWGELFHSFDEVEGRKAAERQAHIRVEADLTGKDSKSIAFAYDYFDVKREKEHQIAYDNRLKLVEQSYENSRANAEASYSWNVNELLGDTESASEAQKIYFETKKISGQLNKELGLPYYVGRNFAELVGYMSVILEGAAKGAAVATPFGAELGIPGMLAAASTGAFYGGSAKTFFTISGAFLLDQKERGVDPEIAAPLAAVVGLGSVLLEVFPALKIAKLFPGVPRLLNTALIKGITKTENQIISKSIGALSTEVVAEDLEALLGWGAENVVTEYNNALKGTNLQKRTKEDLLEELIGTTKAVTAGVLPIITAGAGSRYVHTTLNRKASERKEKQFDVALEKLLEPPKEDDFDTQLVDPQGAKVDITEVVPITDNDTIVVDSEGKQQAAIPITPTEIAQQSMRQEESPVDGVEFDRITEEGVTDEDLDTSLEKQLQDAKSVSAKYGDFKGELINILGKKKARVIEKIISVRAKAKGKTKEQWLGDLGVRLQLIEGKDKRHRGFVDVTNSETELIINAFQHTNLRDMLHEIAHVFTYDLNKEELALTEAAFGVKNGEWKNYNFEDFANGFTNYIRENKAPVTKLEKVFEKLKVWLAEIKKELDGEWIPVSPEIAEVFDTFFQGTLSQDTVNKVVEAKSKTDKLFAKTKGVETELETIVGWTPKRIDQEIERAAYLGGRTKAVLAFVNPMEFIEATTTGSTQIKEIRDKAKVKPIDVERLTRETQTPFIYVDENDRIVGHEGRHRLAALAEAGVENVPVVLDYRTPEFREIKKGTYLSGQKFTGGQGQLLQVQSLVPLIPENRKRLNDAFGRLSTLFAKTKGVKAQIREVTGQKPIRTGRTVDVHVAYKEALRLQAKAAKVAKRLGDKEGFEKAKNTYEAIMRRYKNRTAMARSRKKLLEGIKRDIKKLKTIIKTGKDVGKFTAAHQDQAQVLIKTFELSPDEAQKLWEELSQEVELDKLAPIDKFKSLIAGVAANTKDLDVEDLKDIRLALQDFYKTGKLLRGEQLGPMNAEIVEAKGYVFESGKEIAKRKGLDPQEHDAYDNAQRSIRKTARIFKDRLLQHIFYDWGGDMEQLDMGLKTRLGSGPAALFGQTMLAKKNRDGGIERNNTKFMTGVAEILGFKDKDGNSDTDLAMRYFWKEEQAGKHTVLEYTRMKKVKLTRKEREALKKAGRKDVNFKLVRRLDVDGEAITRTLPFNKQELRNLVMESRDPDVRRTLINEGISEAHLRQLQMQLETTDIDLINYQIKFYDEMFDPINEVYRFVFATNLRKRKNYSPISRDIDTVTKAGPQNDLLAEMKPEAHPEASSTALFLRRNSQLLLKPQSDIGKMNNYIRQMEHFKAYAALIMKFNGLFKDIETRDRIRSTWGKGFLKIIDDFILDIARNGAYNQSNAGWEKSARNVRVGLAKGMVALKAAGMFKQWTSFLGFTQHVPVDQFMVGVFDFFTDPKVAIEEMKRLSPDYLALRAKYATFDRDLAAATNNSEIRTWIESQTIGKIIPMYEFNKLSMALIKTGDIGAIYAGGWAYFKYLRDVKGWSEADAMFEVEIFTEKTQQTAEIAGLSPTQRGGEVLKGLTMFTSSQRLYGQAIILALQAHAAGKKDAGIEQTAKTLMIFLVALPVLYQAVAMGGAEDEEDLRAILKNVIATPMQAVPFAGHVSNYLLSSMIEGTTYGRGLISPPIVAPIESLLKGISKLTAKDVDFESVLSASRDIGRITEYSGLAGGSVGTIAVGMNDVLRGGRDNEKLLKGVMELLGYSPYTAGARAKKYMD